MGIINTHFGASFIKNKPKKKIGLIINNGVITTDKIKDSSITTNKIANNAVTTNKVDNSAITEDKIASSAVTTSKIADNSIITPVIANKAVTEVKLADNAVSGRTIIDKSISEDKLSDSLKDTITKAMISSSKQKQVICIYDTKEIGGDIFNGGYSEEYGDLSEEGQLKIGDYAFNSADDNLSIYVCKDPTGATEWEEIDLAKIPKDIIFLSTYCLGTFTPDFTLYTIAKEDDAFKLFELNKITYSGTTLHKAHRLYNAQSKEQIFPEIVEDSIKDNSIEEKKLNINIKNKLNFYDCIPYNEDVFNPIYRINSDWLNNDFKNQGTIDCTLDSGCHKELINEGIGFKVHPNDASQYVTVVSNMTIPLTKENYTPTMTYLNYCKMGSMPTDDVELITSTSMQKKYDNRYHVLVWEKTGLARADWKIDGSWSGGYYTDDEGFNVQLSDADLNKAFLVTADLSNYIFTLYSFDGKTVEKRGTVTIPNTFIWQMNYANGVNRRQMGLGQAITGGSDKDAIFYEAMIWNVTLTIDEINTVFNKLKYYSD